MERGSGRRTQMVGRAGSLVISRAHASTYSEAALECRVHWTCRRRKVDHGRTTALPQRNGRQANHGEVRARSQGSWPRELVLELGSGFYSSRAGEGASFLHALASDLRLTRPVILGQNCRSRPSILRDNSPAIHHPGRSRAQDLRPKHDLRCRASRRRHPRHLCQKGRI